VPVGESRGGETAVENPSSKASLEQEGMEKWGGGVRGGEWLGFSGKRWMSRLERHRSLSSKTGKEKGKAGRGDWGQQRKRDHGTEKLKGSYPTLSILKRRGGKKRKRDRSKICLLQKKTVLTSKGRVLSNGYFVGVKVLKQKKVATRKRTVLSGVAKLLNDCLLTGTPESFQTEESHQIVHPCEMGIGSRIRRRKERRNQITKGKVGNHQGMPP